MVSAGQELTPGDTYGNALIKSGQTQLKLGQIEREFAAKADRDFIKPLKKFLDEDAKALTVSIDIFSKQLYQLKSVVTCMKANLQHIDHPSELVARKTGT